MADFGVMEILSVASTAFSVVGGFTDAANAKATAEAQQRMYNMQAEQARLVGERNALILEDQKKNEALQQEAAANSAAATGQRAAIEERRKLQLAQSRARAVGANNTGDTLDPTSLDITTTLEGEGTYNALTQLYAGNTEAQSQNYGATLSRYEGATGGAMTRYGAEQDAQNLIYRGNVARAEGSMAATKARIGAMGSLFSGGSSLMSKYAPSAAKTTSNVGWVDWNDGGSTYYGGYR